MTQNDIEGVFDYQLRDPVSIASYLGWALEKDGREGFLDALREVVRFNGGMSNTAVRAGLDRGNLHTALSRDGDPKLSTVIAVMKALGLQMDVCEIGAKDKAMAERYAADPASFSPSPEAQAELDGMLGRDAEEKVLAATIWKTAP